MGCKRKENNNVCKTKSTIVRYPLIIIIIKFCYFNSFFNLYHWAYYIGCMFYISDTPVYCSTGYVSQYALLNTIINIDYFLELTSSTKK